MDFKSEARHVGESHRIKKYLNSSRSNSEYTSADVLALAGGGFPAQGREETFLNPYDEIIDILQFTMDIGSEAKPMV
jgi:hypothetical protein